jgi:hypothetical protein
VITFLAATLMVTWFGFIFAKIMDLAIERMRLESDRRQKRLTRHQDACSAMIKAGWACALPEENPAKSSAVRDLYVALQELEAYGTPETTACGHRIADALVGPDRTAGAAVDLDLVARRQSALAEAMRMEFTGAKRYGWGDLRDPRRTRRGARPPSPETPAGPSPTFAGRSATAAGTGTTSAAESRR